jgi:hypothetical protein
MALLLALLLALQPPSPPAPPQTVDPSQFQSFLGSWSPSTAPLCAAIDSASRWETLFHPAAVMYANRPFEPAPAYWIGHGTIVVARAIYNGDTAHVFAVNSVTRDNGAMRIDYTFRPTPKSSSTMNWWFGISVSKPMPQTIEIAENGKLVCTLNTARGPWRLPPPAR